MKYSSNTKKNITECAGTENNQCAHMLFVGVDPSIKNTGLCVIDLNRNPSIHLFDISKIGKISKDPIERYLDISDILVNAITSIVNKYDNVALCVCYEDYSYHSTHKAFAIGELGGCVKTRLTLLKNMPNVNTIQFTLIPPTKLKKFASKDGTVSKEIMLQCLHNTMDSNNGTDVNYIINNHALRSITDASRISDDIADAYFLAEYGAISFLAQNKIPTDNSTTCISGYTILNLRNKLSLILTS